MKFSCPRCAHALEACRSFIGFSVRCPGCHHPVAVPKEEQASSTTAAPQDKPEPPPAVPAAEPDPAPSPKRRDIRRVGVPVAVATVILLSGIALIVKYAGPAAMPPPLPSPPESPLHEVSSSTVETAQDE